ncbi:hypothetical protein BDZ97DRAFT_1846391, partial [Flammula alnicola]
MAKVDIQPDAIPAPEDNVKPLNYREQFSGRHVTSKFIDPCAAASKASMDCLNRNDYDEMLVWNTSRRIGSVRAHGSSREKRTDAQEGQLH